MAFFNNGDKTAIDPVAKYLQSYASARSFLLSVTGFTLINLILALTESGVYFLYSAFASYSFGIDALICFIYPEETGLLMAEATTTGIISLVICLLLLLPFFLSWIFSKKSRGWLTVGLVFAILDTLYMFIMAGFDTGYILDYIFHIILIVILAVGVNAGAKLKKLNVQNGIPTENANNGVDQETFNNGNDNF